MNFVEKNTVIGHLTIIKIDNRTKKEEVVFDDSNVICGGMGRSIAQIMSLSECYSDKCGVDASSGDACNLRFYQISRYQVGIGASGISATSSVVGLASPLKFQDYGGETKSVNITQASLYSDENVKVSTKETFGILNTIGRSASSITNTWVMDEETANGQRIDEAGLFVQNPYLRKTEQPFVDIRDPKIPLLGYSGPGVQDTSNDDISLYEPGHILCAYKQFSPIYKENYFTLLFRWKIIFL